MPAPRTYDASGRRTAYLRRGPGVRLPRAADPFRDGYHRMTVRSVAGQAGVSPETVYKAFGGKPGLMKALWDVTLAGDDQPVAIADRPQMQEVLRSAADPAEKLRRWAGFVRRQPAAGAAVRLLARRAPRSPAARHDPAEQLTSVRALVPRLADAGLLGPA